MAFISEVLYRSPNSVGTELIYNKYSLKEQGKYKSYFGSIETLILKGLLEACFIKISVQSLRIQMYYMGVVWLLCCCFNKDCSRLILRNYGNIDCSYKHSEKILPQKWSDRLLSWQHVKMLKNNLDGSSLFLKLKYISVEH